MIQTNFAKDLNLWLPNQVEDKSILEKYETAQQAVDVFQDLIYTPQEFCDILFECGVDIDDYLDTVNFNINH